MIGSDSRTRYERETCAPFSRYERWSTKDKIEQLGSKPAGEQVARPHVSTTALEASVPSFVRYAGS